METPELPQDTPAPESPPHVASEPLVVTLGGIGVTKNWLVTPAGTTTLLGTHWGVVDRTRTTSYPKWWVIVGIIVLFPIGLLLLFVPRDERTRGDLEISVTNGALSYTARIPITSDAENTHAIEDLDRARALTAAAAGRPASRGGSV